MPSPRDGRRLQSAMLDAPDFPSQLAAARRGENAAWRSLYRAHAPSILGYLRAQRAPSPEDILGEVWLPGGP